MLLARRLQASLHHPRAAVRVPMRLGLSAATAAAALWLVAVLEPLLGIPALFPSFVAIVFLSAKVAGTSEGIVTMAVFAAGYYFLFEEPRGSFAWRTHSVVMLVAYAAAGIVVARIGGVLREAYARLSEEHRAVTTSHEQREDLLRALAHDVRTPLGVITMNATLLTRDAADPGAVRRRAQAIERSAAHVAGMLNELVDTARLESGHLRLDRRPVDLASFVAELESRLEGTLPLDRVTVAIPEGLPAADVDPQRFERILVNLLSNALKYAPPPSPIVLGAGMRDGDLVVTVADRGPGISQEDVPHLFEKYYRARGTQQREGLGIGLYATRLLVQAHGGRIWVVSKLGEGTTFHVAVPTAPAEAAHATARSGSAVEPARGGAGVRPAAADEDA